MARGWSGAVALPNGGILVGPVVVPDRRVRDLRELLIDLVGRGSYQLVVNLDKVGFLDSTGLGVLVGGLKRVRAHDGSLAIHVHNDPPPLAPAAAAAGSPGDRLPSGCHGLIGLRERAELLGGHLQAAPADNGGFDLLVTLGQKRPPA